MYTNDTFQGQWPRPELGYGGPVSQSLPLSPSLPRLPSLPHWEEKERAAVIHTVDLLASRLARREQPQPHNQPGNGCLILPLEFFRGLSHFTSLCSDTDTLHWGFTARVALGRAAVTLEIALTTCIYRRPTCRLLVAEREQAQGWSERIYKTVLPGDREDIS